MADFKKAYILTMGHEGGYANDPVDTGGETWKGISRKNWPSWKGWIIVDQIKRKVVVKTFRNLNKSLFEDKELDALVQSFYKKNFWDCLQLDSIKSQEVACQLFDVGVNMGTARAAKFLQMSILPAVSIDGQIGLKTITGANSMNPIILYNRINDYRKQKYLDIIADNPSQIKFKASWMSRIVPFDKILKAS